MKLFGKVLISALVSAFMFAGSAQAQFKVAPGKYAVKFTDKNGNGYSVDRPQEFLSQKALDRRAKWNIGITEQDLPVNMAYVDSLKSLGFRVHCISKWYNSCVVVCDSTMLDTLSTLSFVDAGYVWIKHREAQRQPLQLTRPKKLKKPVLQDKHVYNYGDGDNQAKMLNVHKLHGAGFTGKGVTIAILDAGFYKANELSSFKPLFKEGRVLGVHDFVDGDSTVFDSDNHGMNVLSCIAANWRGKLVGTAPDASVYLFRTEDAATENIVEEFNFVSGAELADSLGVDMMHASLGYQKFDDTSVNYTREDNDGNTTIASVACDIAASKGIVITISAGNGGDSSTFPWITSPADADSVLAVGAVDKDRKLAYFSSRGPTLDGRVKPDVCAQGMFSAVQGASDRITRSSGTSFAGPILAGCVMCLMQAHPNAPVVEILNAVRASGHQWDNPDADYGYGIPDFEIAHKILLKKKL
ncbi:MAG: S8 family serine peptidase [Bacteroidales bacterium]|nr:S8 family serine peptidase [Bacteroidales bacterium]